VFHDNPQQNNADNEQEDNQEAHDPQKHNLRMDSLDGVDEQNNEVDGEAKIDQEEPKQEY
jgi:hypothetical protein